MAQELGPFDAHFLVPTFFEARRLSRDSVHYLIVAVPVHETEFARDSLSGSRHNYLPDDAQEETVRRTGAADVQPILLDDVRDDSLARLLGWEGR